MKSGWTWIATSLSAGALLLSACGKGGEAGEAGAAASGGEPALVITDQAEWDALAEAGKESYENACSSCHAETDDEGNGPALRGHREPSAEMRRQIRKGSGRMAPIGENKLPESEMKGLLVYLATIDAVGDIKGP